ncbi:MAG TPA: DUF2254 domain-containing protein [Acidimicrobiales bacterium]|nr:DUF2254 domain-containing protein [Acidimicrobiales bacterium]
MLRLRTVAEAFRNSLFFLPSLFVLASVVLWRVMLTVDATVDSEGLPELVRFGPGTAGPLLATIAGATITVAGIVFSVTVVAVQLASSQFSPRVLRGFLRDRFQQVVMGLMVGTFTYAMLTLGSAGDATPHLTVAVAEVLALVALLGILASIDHTARNMVVGEIARRITDETVETVVRTLRSGPEGSSASTGQRHQPPQEDPTLVVRSPETGWVQQLDGAGLLGALPAGATAELEARVGSFVVADRPLVRLWCPDGVDGVGRLQDEVGEHVVVGRARTMQEDPAFGIRQLVDVALRALSPAINDPTTAYEVVVHLGAVLVEVVKRQPVARLWVEDRDRRLLRPREIDVAGYLERSFGQIRASGREHPVVHIAILGVLAMLADEALASGLRDRVTLMRRQAELVLAEADQSSTLAFDRDRVRRAAAPLVEEAAAVEL